MVKPWIWVVVSWAILLELHALVCEAVNAAVCAVVIALALVVDSDVICAAVNAATCEVSKAAIWLVCRPANWVEVNTAICAVVRVRMSVVEMFAKADVCMPTKESGLITTKSAVVKAAIWVLVKPAVLSAVKAAAWAVVKAAIWVVDIALTLAAERPATWAAFKASTLSNGILAVFSACNCAPKSTPTSVDVIAFTCEVVKADICLVVKLGAWVLVKTTI